MANSASSLAQVGENGLSPEPEEAQYAIWLGAFPGASMINFQSSGKRTLTNLIAGKLTMDVLDCTLANGCVTPTMPGIRWIPIKPATNAAFCAALVQKIIADKTYNKDALSFTTQKAAVAGGYGGYTNASYLVIIDEKHPNYQKLMRPADAGLTAPDEKDKEGKDIEQFVVIDAATGKPTVHTRCAQGVLDWDGAVNGVAVKSGFKLLTETVNAYTMDQYSQITGVSKDDLNRIACEYTSHGTRVGICHKGGSAASVNGIDTVMGAAVLHALVGANQMIGGNAPNSPAPTTTGNGARYKLGSVEGKPSVSTKNATYISRTVKAWRETDEYKNRIASGESDPKPLMPWFANGAASDSQALLSIVNRYPYQCKILTSFMCNTIQGTPGAMRDEVVARLCDTEVVPLHIACDVFVGEHAQYADYIVPDLTPYESFGLPTIGTTFTGYGTTVRWQVKEPESMVLSDGRHASWEAFLSDVAAACSLPGWGEGAIVDVNGKTWPLHDASDFYLKAVANLAYAEQPVDDIAESDIHAQALDHLPERFKAAVSDQEWPKVLNVLSRGGRYWPMSFVHDADGRRSRGYEDENQAYFYSEKRATNTNCYSGKQLPGTLYYTPETFTDLSLMTDHFSRKDYPFSVSEHKARFRSTSMLSNSPLMRDLCAHNYLEINREDAEELGIKDGDRIRAITPLGDVSEGVAMVRAGQIKGAFAIAFGYGHSNYGAQDIELDGQRRAGNPAIGAGVRTHQMLDPTVSGVTRGDVLSIIAENDAASPGRSGGMFKIEKIEKA